MDFNKRMKKFLSLMLMLLAIQGIHAQTLGVRHFEGDLHAGVTFPLSTFHNGSSRVGPAIGAELRYNLNGSLPLDFGVVMDFSAAVYHWDEDGLSDAGESDQSNRTFSIQALCDYNFGQGKAWNPFVGLALGWGQHDIINDDVYLDGDGQSCFVITPRVGLEICRHVRFTLNANISRTGYNTLGLTIGYVFGGGLKD
jgi:hypothetical protein